MTELQKNRPVLRSALRLFVLVALVGAALGLPRAARASQTQVHVVSGFGDVLAGELEGLALHAQGTIALGAAVRSWTRDLPGPVMALTRATDGGLYAATANPGRIWRVVEGAPPELVIELEQALITGLFASGPRELVALSAPKGGAHFIDLSGARAPRVVPLPDIQAILAGAWSEGTLFAVGGGEEGSLWQLSAGAAKFEHLATVGESYLRSIAVGPSPAGRRIVVGGADEGVVYRLEGGRLRALCDAAPTEVVALALSAAGDIYAAIVDAEGKLSAGASERDKRVEEKKERGSKARKVKSAEVLHISPEGRVDVLFQSKSHGAYSLLLLEAERRVLVGTGARGRILALDATGRVGPEVYASLAGHEEVTALLADAKAGVLFGTAHAAGVHQLGPARAATGVFRTAPLDAKALARFGRLDFAAQVPKGSSLRIDVRSGQTRTPDETWSEFSPALVSPGVPEVPPGRYIQVRATLRPSPRGESPRLVSARLAYLVENRPPEVGRVEVLAPGWRVVASGRDASESRSVTFNQDPFKRFLSAEGGALPALDDRPGGKQRHEPGWRTIYAWVEDADEDALRYRFFLGRVNDAHDVVTWTALKEWSDEPFVSFEAARHPDGRYRVRVEVDDLWTNGVQRARSDSGVTPIFHNANRGPVFSGWQSRQVKGGVRVGFEVRADLPLAALRCAVGGEEWLPLDPDDGILDSEHERFTLVVGSADSRPGLQCEAMDEGRNHVRTSWPLAP